MLKRMDLRVYICRVNRDRIQPVCVNDQTTLSGEAGELKAFRELLDTEGPTDRAIALFRRIVLDHYRAFGRRMPWRETSDPYSVLVSEVMLQQTQVDRVRPKYEAFLEAFPDVESLTRATPADVLRAWQGLGYNRRALALQAAAARIAAEFGGQVPPDPEVLETLPGIGPATAAAIAAYAFDSPTVYIETNVRRVFLHFFFRDRTGVTDAELRPLVERALDRDHPREWYWALMDYGTMLARSTPNPNRRSAHHAVQSPFEGSARQLRGRILKVLLGTGPLEMEGLAAATGAEPARLSPALAQLRNEGFVAEDGPIYRIHDGNATEHLK
jgi:A/G-specific adenine glycosylase